MARTIDAATSGLGPQEANPNNIRDVLNRAAALIVKRGLAKDTYRDNHGCLCMFGAIAVAAKKRLGYAHQGSHPIHQLLVKVTGYGSPGLWNDEPERTKAEVVAALREAAKLAETQP
jgi:hypothetical protein